MANDAETLAEAVSRLRRERGLKLRELVARTGNALSLGYMSHIENGVAVPSRDKVLVLRRVLDPNGDERLMAKRDKEELQRLGFEPEVAQLVASLAEALLDLDEAGRRDVLGEIYERLDELIRPA